MQHLPKIEVVYLPLGNRVSNYESGDYLIDTTFTDNEFTEPEDFDFQLMMMRVERISNLYSPDDVYKIAFGYHERCKQLLGKLMPRKIDLHYNFENNTVISRKTPSKKQASLMKHWESELKYYIDHLKTILKSRKSIVSTSTIRECENSLRQPAKIKLLVDKKVFATLFYDLWQGQNIKGVKEVFKPILKADKKDLVTLILNNFVDEDGKPLPLSSIDDILNTSQSKARYKSSDHEKIKLSYQV